MNKNGTEPIVSIEKVVQYAIVVRLWSNHGRKVPHHPRKVPHKQKKALKTNGFQGFDGGDKRDRTADLLNAIQALSQLSYTPIFSCCARQLLYYTAHKRICQENFSLFAEILPICRIKTSPVMSVTGDA